MKVSTALTLIVIASIVMFTVLGNTVLKTDCELELARMRMLQNLIPTPRLFVIPQRPEGESEAERASVWKEPPNVHRADTAQN